MPTRTGSIAADSRTVAAVGFLALIRYSLPMPRTFRPLSTLSPTHVDQLVDLYQGEWWTQGRIRSDVETMLQGSDFIFAYEDGDGKLCAFARAITDGIFKAMIFDVIVRKDLRGTQLGARIMQDVRTHPVLSKVKHVELYCLPELQGFYGQFGFSSDVSGTSMMRLSQGVRNA